VLDFWLLLEPVIGVTNLLFVVTDLLFAVVDFLLEALRFFETDSLALVSSFFSALVSPCAD